MNEFHGGGHLNIKCKVLTWITPILTAIYPLLFLYFQNIGELNLNNVLPTLIYIILITSVIFIIVKLLVKSNSLSSLFTSVMVIVFFNYSYIEKAVQLLNYRIRYWHIVPSLLFLLIVLIILFRGSGENDIVNNICKIISLVFSLLIVFNFALSINTIITKINSDPVNDNVSDLTMNVSSTNDLPNVYYILLDEYASFEFIKKYYDYDNYEFQKFLLDKKFNISMDSYNDSILTATIMSNIHSLDYKYTDETPQTIRMESRKNSSIFSLMKQKGYKTKFVDTDNIDNENTIPSDIKFTFSGPPQAGWSKFFWQSTILYPLQKTNLNSRAQLINSAFEFTENSEYSSGLFTHAHIVCPHELFVFDQNGNEISPKDSSNYEDKRFYLDQFIYTTKKLEDILTNIISKEPECIIILQSDHSSRFQFDQELWKRYGVQEHDVKNILNAVYYQGETFEEFYGKGGVNTMRIVLSELLNVDLPLVEEPK